jgi:SAM-dependent methyltransferase
VTAEDGGYLLPNREAAAGARLALLSEIFDASTFRHLAGVGIGPGWRCWEVGAGRPDVPRWLAGRVGPSGSVLVTDIDVTHLADLADAGPHVAVRRHDVGADPSPDGTMDLVHARLVLTHVPHRGRALGAMAAALQPGGWLVVEDADPSLQPLTCLDEYGPEQVLANRLRAGFRHLLAGRGADLAFGRTLPRLLRETGLEEVGADAFFPVTSPAAAALELATVEQVRGELVAAGLATAVEIDRHLRAVRSGGLDLATSPMISAWGRKPPEEAADASPPRRPRRAEPAVGPEVGR